MNNSGYGRCHETIEYIIFLKPRNVYQGTVIRLLYIWLYFPGVLQTLGLPPHLGRHEHYL